jgi:hypothetical protein
VQFHFTPTRASWLNQVESWFSILEKKSLHGASVKQLRDYINAFIETYISMPNGFSEPCSAFAATMFSAE